jgi:hypothetical protein
MKKVPNWELLTGWKSAIDRSHSGNPQPFINGCGFFILLLFPIAPDWNGLKRY